MLDQVDEGLKSLEQAMRLGFENYDQIRKDKNLAAVRGSAKFQPLLDKVRAGAVPGWLPLGGMRLPAAALPAAVPVCRCAAVLLCQCAAVLLCCCAAARCRCACCAAVLS